MDISNSIVILSVSEFVEYINIAIGQRKVSIEGEISGYHLNQGKWVFFDLKDQDSKIGCFAASWNLHAALEDGMQVVVHGVPRVYGKSGKFSIMVDSIELRGEGALRRAFELTKKKLEAEGLFDVARKRSLPQFPEKIGIIASRESAAYTDFMRIVSQRWGGVELYLYHVQVQGERAVSDIVKAFEWFNTIGFQEGVQSIALIRGGGSLEDLQAFNSESVARAVFGSRIPVVCGVGHERDESLADYAADVRAATPTHAAGLIVPNREEISDVLAGYTVSLSRSLEYTLEWHAHGIQSHLSTLTSSLHRHTMRFGELQSSLFRADEQIRHAVSTMREVCTVKATRMHDAMRNILEQRSATVSFFERSLAQVNPLTVLKRGYTITRKKGNVVPRMQGLQPEETLSIQFSDGTIDVKTV
ncbi:MAG: exodeoxyribonuclease VII large subunit [Candidatus Uhrbacteria bacterium]|nr:exodeoxyribonuclease VII large subunit [Candidatus Uhrbacteria bacterium]